ncbi:L,D-transpeptidase family protein, partial [Sulfurovum sp.]|uniref:L,D-transpeptidase family protein n=1 Tax=Sulfurovum sp. TaxID=1969726 RepID=UPI00286818B6
TEMRAEIKKSVVDSSKKVKELYKAIDYRPIWVDKDHLTQFTELLVQELKEDFEKGLHAKLVANYKKLLPNDEKVFASNSLKDRVVVELGVMQLYVDHISAILKEKKSKHTSLSLLQYALEEKSLIEALNVISVERIAHRMPTLDQNTTIFSKWGEIDQNQTRTLMSGYEGDKKERLKAMYRLLDYKSIWVREKGLTSFGEELFTQIGSDITLDKNTTTYKRYVELQNMALPKDKRAILEYEFEIAKLYQAYMTHALYGNIDWKKFKAKLRRHHRNGDWVVHNILFSPESLLIESLNKKTLNHAFTKAKPVFPLYERMLVALKKYQDIDASGGWETLPKFPDLKVGASDPVIPLLRERLKAEGYSVDCADTHKYDTCLLNVMQIFQRRHGLADEGYIGKLTRKALSETVAQKIDRIKLNIDRIKWIKRSNDKHHILVNIPSYTMYVFDEGEVIQSMKVIVGRKGHETPIFYGRVRTIVLNPYWRIPASIIRHEMIPKLKKNPHYTNSKNIEIHTGYSEHSPRVNPLNVNWHKYGRRLPPYRFMQSPGVKNALGKVKYLFPNKYAVYMHDTNQRHLFEKDVRSLSHGCVRLHKPFELLETFSTIDPIINFEKSQKILEDNKKRAFRLSQTVPVDMIYLTTWVDMEGTIQFRDDVYGYDKLQLVK